MYKAHKINARTYHQKICFPLREQSENNTSTGGQVRREVWGSQGSRQLSSFPTPRTKNRHINCACCDRITDTALSADCQRGLCQKPFVYILVPGSSLGPSLLFSAFKLSFSFSGHFKFMRNSVLMFIQGSKLKWMFGACCVCIDCAAKNNKSWTGPEGLLKGGPLYSGYLRTSILLRVFD